jgi:hypothetical protein
MFRLAGADVNFAQETRRVFDEAVSGPDVERDGQGRIAVHGRTVMVWTSKIM